MPSHLLPSPIWNQTFCFRATAFAEIEEASKEVTAGRIMAALTFSFWTGMLSPAYEARWRATLNRMAETQEGKRLPRKSFSRLLTQIRLLRNRTAHHKLILHWNFPEHHGSILKLNRWLYPPVHYWAASNERLDAMTVGGYDLVTSGNAE